MDGSVTPVPAYGLERLRTAIEPTGAEVELIDPYLVSEEPLGFAREAAQRFRPDLVGLGIRIIDDCIVVDRLDAAQLTALGEAARSVVEAIDAPSCTEC